MIGIVLGVLLGIAIVILFVFYASEETIDPPSIDEDGPQRERRVEPERSR
ncbi:MAG TPA: hypothetical protein VE401_02045 [Solirubrobacterales bacterium]|nr:hypothetical protein [Solirubrobacterales bacterium]